MEKEIQKLIVIFERPIRINQNLIGKKEKKQQERVSVN